MHETSYNGISYCFFDDHLTLNGNAISYELMDNIQHRGGDAPAFIFDYSGQKFAMPYSRVSRRYHSFTRHTAIPLAGRPAS